MRKIGNVKAHETDPTLSLSQAKNVAKVSPGPWNQHFELNVPAAAPMSSGARRMPKRDFAAGTPHKHRRISVLYFLMFAPHSSCPAPSGTAPAFLCELFGGAAYLAQIRVNIRPLRDSEQCSEHMPLQAGAFEYFGEATAKENLVYLDLVLIMN